MIGLFLVVLFFAVRAKGPDVYAYGSPAVYVTSQGTGMIRVDAAASSEAPLAVAGWIDEHGSTLSDIFIDVDSKNPVRATAVTIDDPRRMRFSGQYPASNLPPGRHRITARALFFDDTSSILRIIGASGYSAAFSIAPSKFVGTVRCVTPAAAEAGEHLSTLVVRSPIAQSSDPSTFEVDSGAGVTITGRVGGQKSGTGSLLAVVDDRAWLASRQGSSFVVRLPTVQMGQGRHTVNFCVTQGGAGATLLKVAPISLFVRPVQEQLSLDTVNGPAVVEAAQSGAVVTIPRDQETTVTGWVVDPAARQPVTSVGISIDGKVLGKTIYGRPRPDVAAALHEPSYTESGFEASLPAGSIAPGNHVLRLAVTSSSGVRSLSKASLNVLVR